ncbi:hypothetical protein D043_0274B, partial [Vibrio parahaemolyticus EKP-021]
STIICAVSYSFWLKITLFINCGFRVD